MKAQARRSEPKPTPAEIVAAVADMKANVRFFPAGGAEQKAIMRRLMAMVGTKPQLDWLVSAMVDRIGEWKGFKELRGVFCSRFPPADGIEGDCVDTAEFTPGELEARGIELHENQKALANGKASLLLTGPEAPIPELALVLADKRTIKTTSIPRRSSPHEVKRTDELLRSLMKMND